MMDESPQPQDNLSKEIRFVSETFLKNMELNWWIGHYPISLT